MSFENWYVAHGTSAKVQDPGNLSQVAYYGWGLQFVQNMDTFGWVHVPIPTVVGSVHCRAVRIYFKTSLTQNIYVWISKVHLWMGGDTPVATFGPDLKAAGPYKELSLNPPLLVGESALGISIGVQAGMDSPSMATDDTRTFILYGAGALFTG